MNIKTTLGIASLVLGLVACDVNENSEDFFVRTGDYNGFKAKAAYDVNGRMVLIDDNDILTDGYLVAHDQSNEGRFNSIRTSFHKGHPTDKFINLDSLEMIYKTISEIGQDNDYEIFNSDQPVMMH